MDLKKSVQHEIVSNVSNRILFFFAFDSTVDPALRLDGLIKMSECMSVDWLAS